MSTFILDQFSLHTISKKFDSTYIEPTIDVKITNDYKYSFKSFIDSVSSSTEYELFVGTEGIFTNIGNTIGTFIEKIKQFIIKLIKYVRERIAKFIDYIKNVFAKREQLHDKIIKMSSIVPLDNDINGKMNYELVKYMINNKTTYLDDNDFDILKKFIFAFLKKVESLCSNMHQIRSFMNSDKSDSLISIVADELQYSNASKHLIDFFNGSARIIKLKEYSYFDFLKTNLNIDLNKSSNIIELYEILYKKLRERIEFSNSKYNPIVAAIETESLRICSLIKNFEKTVTTNLDKSIVIKFMDYFITTVNLFTQLLAHQNNSEITFSNNALHFVESLIGQNIFDKKRISLSMSNTVEKDLSSIHKLAFVENVPCFMEKDFVKMISSNFDINLSKLFIESIKLDSDNCVSFTYGLSSTPLIVIGNDFYNAIKGGPDILNAVFYHEYGHILNGDSAINVEETFLAYILGKKFKSSERSLNCEIEADKVAVKYCTKSTVLEMLEILKNRYHQHSIYRNELLQRIAAIHGM